MPLQHKQMQQQLLLAKILVEKCKVQFNSLTAKVSTEQCNTSYVWLGATSMGKAKLEEGTNPNNNVITIK